MNGSQYYFLLLKSKHKVVITSKIELNRFAQARLILLFDFSGEKED